MLFNSPAFLFLFLPCAFLGWLLVSRHASYRAGIYWLTAASLLFYGMSGPWFLALLLATILANFLLGRVLLRPDGSRARRKAVLLVGIVTHLSALVVFKYAGFAVGEIERLLGMSVDMPSLVLPIGISFFTFQQIAFLVDAYRRDADAPSLVDHTLFIAFFPQLIAGPIVHHKEMMPQFAGPPDASKRQQQLATGIVYLVIGLFKKVVIADAFARRAGPIFEAADAGQSIDLIEGWIAAASYALQIYFDFSAYSDMAMGIAFLFGIRLPINFNSPYQATSIIDFWRRWHMTLSRFLRDYVYVPLGGNRGGKVGKYRNIFLVMVIGGVWHGAGWTFLVWGAVHGALIVINHVWRDHVRAHLRVDPFASPAVARTFTLLAVVIAWVFFRAETLAGAGSILSAMLGLNGLALPAAWLGDGAIGQWLQGLGIREGMGVLDARTIHQPLLLCLGGFAACLLLPNSHQLASWRWHMRLPEWLSVFIPGRPTELAFLPTPFAGAAIALAAWIAISLLSKPSVFIYFRF